MKQMSQAQMQAKHQELQKWVNHYGLKTVMRNVAHHLLPDIPFTFKLNLGGGSYTDGKEVVVGIPELTWGMDKNVILSVTKALVGHETEHVWSSDFKVFKKFQQDVVKYFKDEYNFAITGKLGAHLLNSTEDGRIEKRLINRYRGYKKHIQLLNGIFWKEQPVKGQNEMMEFLYCITSMCVTGLKSKEWETFYGGTRQDELLDEIRPLIMRAINNPTAQGCADNTMDIVRVIAPYMHELLQDLKNQQDMEKELNGEPDYSSSNPQEGADSQPGSSQSSHFLPEEDPKPQEKGEGDEGEGDSDEESEEQEGKGKGKSSKDEDQEKSDSEGEEKEEEGEGKGDSKEDSDSDAADSDNSSDSSDASDSEDGEKAEGKKNDGEMDGDSEDTSNPSDEDSLENNTPILSSEEVERLIDQAMSDVEEDINEDAQSMLEEGRHEVERQEAIERKENEYKGHLSPEDMKKLDKSVEFVNRNPENRRSTPLPADVKKNGQHLNKELRKILLNKQTFTSKNRRNGVLDANSLWKKSVKDYNMFMKKGVPNDTSVAINVLVDFSGSMESTIDNRGTTKLDMAIRAVATIEEGLRDLVPHRISFFSAGYGQVLHSTVKDFNQESKDTLSWKRVPNIPSWANRDGYSIKVGALEVLKRPERRKILIVLSDGLPTEPNQTMGQREVKEAVRQARQDGVSVIAIAFGSQQEMNQNADVYREMYQKGIIMVQPADIHKELAKFIKNEMTR